MIKESIQHEVVTIINVQTQEIKQLKHRKQILTDVKAEISSNKIIIVCFNTSLTMMDRTTSQKTNKTK